MRRLLLILDTDARDVLIAHQRLENEGCSCGWRELGASFADHVLAALHNVGLSTWGDA